jgi:hypothetical protein
MYASRQAFKATKLAKKKLPSAASATTSAKQVMLVKTAGTDLPFLLSLRRARELPAINKQKTNVFTIQNRVRFSAHWIPWNNQRYATPS